MEQPPERRLAAILMADVVGHSRVIGRDEGATVRTIKTYREVFSSNLGWIARRQ